MKQNPIVYILVAVAMLFVFWQIPQISRQSQKIQRYESYSQFVQDFREGRIATVTLHGKEKATGEFQKGQKGDKVMFIVQIPDDPQLAKELMAMNPRADVRLSGGMLGDKIIAILAQVIPFLLIAFLFYLFLVRQMKMSGGQAMSFGRSHAKMASDSFAKVTFDDVAGMEEVKEELEEVVDFLRDPERFRALGAQIPRGVLLVGPPGCGKTLLARAVAGEAGVAFFYISGSDFVEMFVGVGASRVRDLFEQAKQHLPAIIFIDELDAVGRLRGAGLGGGHDEREQTLNALLVEMDGFDPAADVILLAATNRPDILDPALLRPGRFDRRVVVPNPDVKEREAILRIYVKNKPLGEDVDLKVLGRRTPGFSGADIENLVNEAALLAARRNKRVVDMSEFDEAIERVIAGPERKSRVIREAERRVLAYHEAGHALVGSMLPNFDATYKVTILPRGMALGYTISLPEDDRYLMTKSEILNRMAQALGGRAAEELVIGDVTTGAANDLERTTEMARQMITEYGMSDELGPVTYGKKHGPVFLARDLNEERNYSEDIARRIDNEVRSIIDSCYARAHDIITDQRDKLDRLVEVLLEKETLDQEEVAAIMAGEELPSVELPDKPTPPAAHKPVETPPQEKRGPVVPRPIPEAPAS
ncbi:MAG: ATP-dependent zinc metalloprotease FtsH [Armatimonadia bacterium]